MVETSSQSASTAHPTDSLNFAQHSTDYESETMLTTSQATSSNHRPETLSSGPRTAAITLGSVGGGDCSIYSIVHDKVDAKSKSPGSHKKAKASSFLILPHQPEIVRGQFWKYRRASSSGCLPWILHQHWTI